MRGICAYPTARCSLSVQSSPNDDTAVGTSQPIADSSSSSPLVQKSQDDVGSDLRSRSVSKLSSNGHECTPASQGQGQVAAAGKSVEKFSLKATEANEAASMPISGSEAVAVSLVPTIYGVQQALPFIPHSGRVPAISRRLHYLVILGIFDNLNFCSWIL